MGSISRHITPLVIISLGGEHTDTQTNIHTLRGQDQYLETRRVPVKGRRVPGLKRNIAFLKCWQLLVITDHDATHFGSLYDN